MKVSFKTATALIFVALSFAKDARSQEDNSLKFGLFTGRSIPLGDYKEGIAKARNGYNYGFSADYSFYGGIGIGIDIRYSKHPHQAPDTTYFHEMYVDGNIANFYSSSLRFGNLGIMIGPNYQIGNGRFSVNLYARAGILLEKFPTYIQRETKHIDYQLPYSTPFTQTRDLSTSDRESSNALGALFGSRLDLEIFPNVGLFLYGDYQTSIGRDGGFRVTNLTTGQNTQPIGVNAVSFGGGLRFSLGGGYATGILRLNP